jgi:putative FmdB family regulatory protein
MPVYVYQCDACGHAFETMQRMSDEPLKKCPECGKAVRRVPQIPAINTGIKNGTVMNSRIRDAGFTKITKDRDGKYRREFGSDPAAKQLPTHRKRK